MPKLQYKIKHEVQATCSFLGMNTNENDFNLNILNVVLLVLEKDFQQDFQFQRRLLC